jgi:exopolyphosphatase/guanosine-5'-triphosphate,3'-diphosphate pyrophosphatase
MPAERRAVIDVGTNSVKLLVAEVDGERVQPLHEDSRQTRLGRGFFETNVLQSEAIRQTVEAVGEFARTAALWHPARTRVLATSAARDARNARELVSAIEASSALSTQIISGEQEAELVFRGVATDPALRGRRLLILDVGGGSTEIILGEGAHHFFRQSFALGSVRLLEQMPPDDPPSAEDLARCRAWLTHFFEREVGPAFEQSLRGQARGDVRLVGTGGTTTILARMEQQMAGFDRDAIERTRLSRGRVAEWMADLWSKSLAQRKQLVGLPPSRADVILMGLAIYEAVMAHFDLGELGVSTRGLRFGAVLEPA